MNETPDTTLDGFLGGKVKIFQPETGYRAGMDAVLLGASVSATSDSKIAEAGCGAGVAMLCAASRLRESTFVGFERDEMAVRLALKSIASNEWDNRVSVSSFDVQNRPLDIENQFDQSICNPPFFDPARVRDPAAGRQSAYLAETPLRAWVLFLLHITRRGGYVTMIHRAAELATLLELLNPRSGEIEVMPIRPAPNAPAKRILVRARKGLRKGDVKLLSGLSLHVSPGGELSSRAAGVMAGDPLEWT